MLDMYKNKLGVGWQVHLNFQEHEYRISSGAGVPMEFVVDEDSGELEFYPLSRQDFLPLPPDYKNKGALIKLFKLPADLEWKSALKITGHERLIVVAKNPASP